MTDQQLNHMESYSDHPSRQEQNRAEQNRNNSHLHGAIVDCRGNKLSAGVKLGVVHRESPVHGSCDQLEPLTHHAHIPHLDHSVGISRYYGVSLRRASRRQREDEQQKTPQKEATEEWKMREGQEKSQKRQRGHKGGDSWRVGQRERRGEEEAADHERCRSSR